MRAPSLSDVPLSTVPTPPTNLIQGGRGGERGTEIQRYRERERDPTDLDISTSDPVSGVWILVGINRGGGAFRFGMSRRPGNPARRASDGGSLPVPSSSHHKSQASPSFSVVLVALGALLLIGYTYSSGGFDREKVSIKDEGLSCTLEVQRTMPFLRKAYGESFNKVLHVGPDTCSVVSMLMGEEKTEAWGIEPYDLEDTDNSCRSLVRKGIVRVANIKFQLPYKTKSFSLVIISDALDYLTPKYLNRTLPELARVSTEGLVVFSGFPGQRRAEVPELSKFGKPAKLRSPSWWIRYFVQTGLEENVTAMKKFEKAASKHLDKLSCQVFHLNSLDSTLSD